MSNLWRPALLVIRHKNVVTHAESLLKILNFEPEDECNSILVAAFDRISSRKYAKTQFESTTFLTLLIVTRMIYLSENWNNFRCREAFPCSKSTSFCFVCLIIYQTSWNFATDNEECSRNVSDQVFSGRWVRKLSNQHTFCRKFVPAKRVKRVTLMRNRKLVNIRGIHVLKVSFQLTSEIGHFKVQ